MKLPDLINDARYGKVSKLSKAKTEYKCFSNGTEADEWGFAIYSAWAKKYKQITQTAKKLSAKIGSIAQSPLECYCGYLYQQINSYMRGNDSVLEQYKEAANILTLFIASAPPIPENIVVYRVVCREFIQTLIDNNKQGCPTCEEGFLSTSLLKDISKEAEHFSTNSYLLKIYVPKGTLGIYVNTVVSRNEYELLIAPNSCLKLVGHPYKDAILQKTVFECELF